MRMKKLEERSTCSSNKPIQSRRTPRRIFSIVGAVLVSLLMVATLSLAGCKDVQKKTIRMGWIPWDEGISVTYLWKHLLEEQGYYVEMILAEAGPIFEGVGSGDLDLYLDAWVPVTHADYMARYEGKIVPLHAWYDEAQLAWAVPDYVDIDSIADIADNKDMFQNRIIGIEPGSGINRLSMESTIPTYGLEDMEFVQGSTVAMLSELKRAIDNQEPVVVTMWHPHWAYSEFPLKDLEDPEATLGEAEKTLIITRLGFEEDQPEVTRWLKNFHMNDEQLSQLVNMVANEYGVGHEDEGVEAWLAIPENRALADSWIQ